MFTRSGEVACDAEYSARYCSPPQGPCCIQKMLLIKACFSHLKTTNILFLDTKILKQKICSVLMSTFCFNPHKFKNSTTTNDSEVIIARMPVNLSLQEGKKHFVPEAFSFRRTGSLHVTRYVVAFLVRRLGSHPSAAENRETPLT